MKKFLLNSTLALVLSICSNQTIYAQQIVKLNLPKGAKVYYNTQSNLKIGVKNSEESGLISTSGDLQFESLGDSAGLTFLKYKPMRIKYSLSGGPNSFSIDTDDANADTTGREGAMLKMYRSLLANNFTLGINSKGEVVQEKGSKEWIKNNKNLIDELSNKTGSKNSFDESSFKQTYTSLFGLYPEKPLNIGLKWKKKTTQISNGITINFDYVYIVDSLLENKAGIKVQADIYGYSPLPDMPDISVNITGKGKGYLWLDTKTGMIIKEVFDSNMESKAESKGGSGGGNEFPVSIIESNNVIEAK